MNAVKTLPLVFVLFSVDCAHYRPPELAEDKFGWRLVWRDEFEGSELGDVWQREVGDGCDRGICGWGNGELQWYQPENAAVANGNLVITAKWESVGQYSYTSARLNTKGQRSWRYGRFEFRAKLPQGQGIWPAVWMLPVEEFYGGWAASGEIDVIELVGNAPNTVHGALHYGAAWPANTGNGNAFRLPKGSFADAFHTFALEWHETQIRWFVDDRCYWTLSSWDTATADFPAPFDREFYLVLNVAVGGDWPGPPDNSTVFPQQMLVDYVRVFQLNKASRTASHPYRGDEVGANSGVELRPSR